MENFLIHIFEFSIIKYVNRIFLEIIEITAYNTKLFEIRKLSCNYK